jgi:hypothetical protein
MYRDINTTIYGILKAGIIIDNIGQLIIKGEI